MPWHRNDPDPLEAMRRKLAEQERLLAEERSRLMRELQNSGEPSSVEMRPSEPPVWRMEEEGASHRAVDPMPVRKRHLARQRQRDMVLFILLFLLFLGVVIIVLWVAYVHNTAGNNGG